MIICFEEKNWRPDEKTLINTGFYSVPRDMSEELARRALAEGVAVLIEDDSPKTETINNTTGYSGGGKAIKKKGDAPENKAR